MFIYICSNETISHMNEVKAESPNGLQSLGKPYVTKIILTEQLFGVGSSNCGFVHLDNLAT